jgi:hypothetical protein
MEEFRFHLTLTGRLSESERQAVWPVLERLTEKVRGVPVPVRDLVVFMQPDNTEPFQVVARFQLGGS